MKIKQVKLSLLIPTLCAAAIALPFASQTARADDASPAPSASAAKTPHSSGTITAVDATAKTITLKGKKSSKTYEVPDSATLTGADGSATTLADLKTGDHVRVTYATGDDGKPAVVTLKVSAAPSK
jgi:Cu/Ag efflux protein CusF